MMAMAAAGPALAAAAKLVGDYIASTKEPPQEVLRAWKRISDTLEAVHDAVMGLGPIPLRDEDVVEP